MCIWFHCTDGVSRLLVRLLTDYYCFIGSLLDFLKEGDGKFLKLPLLVDMAAQVRRITTTCSHRELSESVSKLSRLF